MMKQKKALTIEDIFEKELYKQNSFNGFQTINAEQKRTILQSLSEQNIKIKIDDFIVAEKEPHYILLFSEITSIYRRSKQYYVYLYNSKTKNVLQLEKTKVRLAAFSPNGKYISYILNNNIIIYTIKTGEKHTVTNDGKKNKIINGHTDWVYEEEFCFTKAYHWNNDSSEIAFLKLNEAKVKQYEMTMYNDSYNENYSYKYPKAGEKNAIVTTHLFKLYTGTTIDINIPSSFEYIPKLTWTKSKYELLIFTLNRLQNQLQVYLYHTKSQTIKEIYKEEDKKYIDFFPEWICLEDKKNILFFSEKDGYKNAYILNLYTKELTQITKNKYDIDQLIHVDTSMEYIFCTIAYPTPMDRNLVAINYNTKKITPLTKGNGYYEVFYNKEQQEFVIQFSNLYSPTEAHIYTLDYTTTGISKLRKQKNTIDNTELVNSLTSLNLLQPEFISIKNKDNVDLNGWILKPNNLNPNKKYPLLLCNYGGPGSQLVLNKYGTVNYWHQLMANYGFIVACFDNTGTGARGADFKKKTYKQLGKYEIEDQIDIANYFAQLDYIDNKKIGHWGWSFGGYMSLLAITKGADIFSFAVAIAPVTNWKYYDSIYTERYMQTPKLNQEGYDQNSPFYYSHQLKGKLLIIHGSADDNVHVQQTILFSEDLIQKNKPFEMFIYPNKNHRINGGNTTVHLWNKITNWLVDTINVQ